MLEFDFLEAADETPLTKRFVQTAKGLDVEPYPYIKFLNSHREQVAGLRDLYDVLRVHASQGHCLLKGLLDRPLKNESRAGHTSAETPTRWILLDLDFTEGWESVDEFLAELNPAWADVSYIFQHSASAGIRYEPGLRGHVWILLEAPAFPAQLKAWLKQKNMELFRNKDGSTRLELTANGYSLRWPLDITTCQNDKLIYIAEPQCIGVDDPLAGRRFELVEKSREFAPLPDLNVKPSAVDATMWKIITELRRRAGLPEAKAKFRSSGTIDVLQNPDEAIVTGVRQARGFVYLNLNGGDSWAYYFPEDKPELLYNFKGEPIVRLKDIAPDFYYNYMEQLQTKRHGTAVRPYVFRDAQTDTYYNVIYDQVNDELKLFAQAGSKDKLKDFLAQFGRNLPETIDDWTVVFDPTTTKVIDPVQKWINRFKASEFIRYADRLSPVHYVPPIIHKVIFSAAGSCEEAYTHFLNWLAFYFQTRQRPNTSWVFHGVSGTGKGLLLDKILRPLFGHQHVTEWTAAQVEDQFNAQLANTLILWLDEFKTTDTRTPGLVMNRIKNYITEETLQIRGMRKDTITVPNHLAIIVASNHPDPLALDPSDRRFNVCPAQETPLVTTDEEVNAIADELPAFASFLKHYEVDAERVRRVLLNEARQQMIEASMNSVEQFFARVRKGDLEWFLDFCQDMQPIDNLLAYQRFEDVLEKWCRRTMLCEDRQGREVKVTRDELLAAYTYVVGGRAPSKAKFSRQCAIYRVQIQPLWLDGRTQRCAAIPFQAPLDRIKEFLDRRKHRSGQIIPRNITVNEEDAND